MVGYGAMMAESMVAIMAMIAACVLQPGIYFADQQSCGNRRHRHPKRLPRPLQLGLSRHRRGHAWPLAQAVGEQTLYNRTGGAPAFAVGMAHIFSIVSAGKP